MLSDAPNYTRNMYFIANVPS